MYIVQHDIEWRQTIVIDGEWIYAYGNNAEEAKANLKVKVDELIEKIFEEKKK